MTYPSNETLPGDDLVSSTDVVAALVRPLTAFEQTVIGDLIARVQRDLRSKMPTIDDRMARWGVEPPVENAVDPELVGDVLAGVIKRYLRNVDGAATVSRGDGPFTTSTSFAFRGNAVGGGTLGELAVTPADIDEINGVVGVSLPATIRLKVPHFHGVHR